MSLSNRPQAIRNALAGCGLGLVSYSLAAWDWRLGTGFLGAVLFILGLVGTIHAGRNPGN